MDIKILKKSEPARSKIFVIPYGELNFNEFDLTEQHKGFIENEIVKEKKVIHINLYDKQLYVLSISEDKKRPEDIRKIGSKLCAEFNTNRIRSVCIISQNEESDFIYHLTEGILLSNYKFLKYKKEDDKSKVWLTNIEISSKSFDENYLSELSNLTDAVFLTRDLANEPYSHLNSEDLSERIKELSNIPDVSVQVFDKKEIEKLEMGGLLAVNKGSNVPPTFSIIEYKPENAINEAPYVLVGKGIVFDTGGYSLKPTKNSMDLMKFDMAGAAAVVGAMYAVSKNKLPVHVIALIPATDNAVDATAYVPGDVIKMHNGLFVEVLNTDAEGRLILADALSYAKKYDPELVIDLATLTGSAAVALGTEAAVVMGTADDNYFESLERSGYYAHERVVKFPFWDEYKEMLKSKVADIKNIGAREAGAITAGKFLEHFTNYPWIHIDIAGPAIFSKKDAYRTVGGSGYGVRLLYNFFKEISKK